MLQMKAAEEVLQVESEEKRDLTESGNSEWFTESFVNICKFGLSFRFRDEPRPLELHPAVLRAATYSSAWHGKACSPPCNSFSNMTEKPFSLLPFSLYILFLLYFMEGELSLSCTILTLSWETGFKKAISLFFPLSCRQEPVCAVSAPLPAPAALPGEQISQRQSEPPVPGQSCKGIKRNPSEACRKLVVCLTASVCCWEMGYLNSVISNIVGTAEHLWSPMFLKAQIFKWKQFVYYVFPSEDNLVQPCELQVVWGPLWELLAQRMNRSRCHQFCVFFLDSPLMIRAQVTPSLCASVSHL